MAYSTSNPPALVSQRVGADGGAQWVYISADNAAAVNAANYFSNGDDLGMKVNDTVRIVDSDGVGTFSKVSAVTAGGAASLTADPLA